MQVAFKSKLLIEEIKRNCIKCINFVDITVI